jgi:hypothetical protein
LFRKVFMGDSYRFGHGELRAAILGVYPCL